MDLAARRPLAVLAALMTLALALLALHAPAHATGTRTDTTGVFRGKVVNQANGNAVKGVTVKVFRINTDTLLGSAKSGPEGRFRIEGLSADDEELDVRVVGRAVHFESGWVACNHKVVQSWGEACSYGQGRQTAFFLQHL